MMTIRPIFPDVRARNARNGMFRPSALRPFRPGDKDAHSSSPDRERTRLIRPRGGGHMVKTIGHFIGGKSVAGTSGRFGDIFNPNTGEVGARVALASQAEVRAAVANAKEAQPGWAAKNPQVRARVMMRFLELANAHREELAMLISTRTRQNDTRCPWRSAARPRGRRVRDRRSAPPQGRLYRRCRPRHRHVLDAPARRRRRRHHAVQLPGHDPLVEGRARHRLRQRVHPQAFRARSFLPDAPRRTLPRSRPSAGHPQCRQRRQGSRRCYPR